MKTLKTTLHVYAFTTVTPEGKAEWKAFKAKLKAAGNGKAFEAWGSGKKYSEYAQGEVVLTTSTLFNNQWNVAGDSPTNPGARAFTWALDVYSGGRGFYKTGHYLVVTDEMKDLLHKRHVCGYCGHQVDSDADLTFCPSESCIGSQYLKADQLHLTRMKRVDDPNPTRDPLTKAEEGHLLPKYEAAQANTRETRRLAALARITADADREVGEAHTGRDILKWLLGSKEPMLIDLVLDGNVLYYAHKSEVGFGWKDPVEDKDALDLLLQTHNGGFLWKYRIK